MAMLEVDHLQKIYTTRFGASQVQALTDVTFSVEKGEYVAIMGESGSGKTTLLNILAALDKPTRGEVRLNGKLLSAISEKELSAFRRDNLGFVFQDFNLLDTFSIRDNIFLPLVLAGCPYREMENRLGPIAQKLGIGGILSKFPYEVSGGQKQRAAVARALITRPQLILADEPTGALDSRATDSLLRLFGEINEDGQTLLMVTHSVKAASHAARVMFIKDGEVFHQLYRGLDGAEGLYQKNRSIYYPYILTAVLTTAMMYIIGSLQNVTTDYSGTLAFSLQLGIVVTSIFSVIFLFYTNSFLMRRRKKEFGLYNILGMEKRHLARLLLWETALMLLISLVLGLAAGVLLDKLMHMLLTRLVGQSVSLTFALSPGSMRYTAALVSLTFVLIWVNSVRQVYFARPVELLRSAEVGEREPKARWLLSLLGLAALGAGYWLSATVKDAAVMILFFFIAVLLVIAGTYLLFTSGSVTLLKALRKNRRYYYKPDHFISVSCMIYRMKQNAVGLANVCVLSTMVLVMVFSTLSLWLGMEDTLNSRLRSDIDVRSASTDVSALEAAVDETLRQAGASREDTWTYRYLSFSALPSAEGFVSTVSFTESDALFGAPATFQVIPLDDYNRMLGRSETLLPGEVLLECTRGNYEGDTLRLLEETFSIKARISDGLGAGQALASIYDYYCLVVDSMDTLERLNRQQQSVYDSYASDIRTTMSFYLSPASPELSQAVAGLLRDGAQENGFISVAERRELRENLMTLYGGLLFVGLFLGLLFTMAMILIIYYKQITEGYEDRERYRIMRKVGLSRREIRRSISSQILIVFFLPLAAAGLHVTFAFPGIVTMFRALSMTNVTLIAGCALGSFAGFAVLYGAVYLLTARVYYRIVSE